VKRVARQHRDDILSRIYEQEEPQLHWIDNFVKILPRHSMHLGKQLLQSMQWTAHGVKFLNEAVDMSWRYSGPEDVIPALPHLDELLSVAGLESLVRTFNHLPHLLYAGSTIVQQDVRVIPIKPQATTEEEAQHLASSYDGLTSFWPLDIHQDCVVNTTGLLRVLKHLQELEGFGVAGHRRFGRYSLLHVTSRSSGNCFVFFIATGLDPIRNDISSASGCGIPITTPT